MIKPQVKLIAHTPEPDKVVASAARLCYSKVGATEIMDGLTGDKVESFLNKLMDLGHESPIEHVSFTFAIEGISRACSHQLVRHRIASYSQQSQRYVKLDQFEYIIPPSITENEVAKKIFIETMERDQEAYDKLVDELIYSMIGQYYMNEIGEDKTIEVSKQELIQYFKQTHKKEYMQIEKKAIEDARYVFPNACETKIVVTMNARSLMNFFRHRCCNRAQWEIRELANLMLKEVKKVAPILFKNAGAPCIVGECPEGEMSCRNSII